MFRCWNSHLEMFVITLEGSYQAKVHLRINLVKMIKSEGMTALCYCFTKLCICCSLLKYMIVLLEQQIEGHRTLSYTVRLKLLFPLCTFFPAELPFLTMPMPSFHGRKGLFCSPMLEQSRRVSFVVVEKL